MPPDHWSGASRCAADFKEQKEKCNDTYVSRCVKSCFCSTACRYRGRGGVGAGANWHGKRGFSNWPPMELHETSKGPSAWGPLLSGGSGQELSQLSAVGPLFAPDFLRVSWGPLGLPCQQRHRRPA